MLILNNGQSDLNSVSILFQLFEGWPKKPELLDCFECSPDNITFESEVMGKFEGKVQNDTLVGEFVEIGYSLNLSRSTSFWQRSISTQDK
ncbi:hypothetical protein [Thaumasiovibrio subtropicus]|uniref:hypothetical protein n=1 Tax=Thaumasiovibrio subtropicus TaxID=1891207 RepID=UPI001C85475F|nr:hypothetical protein [Thaumasiovibrio subtropicus]